MQQQDQIKTIVWQEDNPLSRLQQTENGQYIYEKGRANIAEEIIIV